MRSHNESFIKQFRLLPSTFQSFLVIQVVLLAVEHVFISQQVRHLRGFVLCVRLLIDALVEVATRVSHASWVVAD